MSSSIHLGAVQSPIVKLEFGQRTSGLKSGKALASTYGLCHSLMGCLKFWSSRGVGESGARPRRSLRQKGTKQENEIARLIFELANYTTTQIFIWILT